MSTDDEYHFPYWGKRGMRELETARQGRRTPTPTVVIGLTLPALVIGFVLGLVWGTASLQLKVPSPATSERPVERQLTPAERLEAKADAALERIRPEIEEFAVAERIPLSRIYRKEARLCITLKPVALEEIVSEVAPEDRAFRLNFWRDMAAVERTLAYRPERGDPRPRKLRDRDVYLYWAFDACRKLTREYEPKWKAMVPGGLLIIESPKESFGCEP